MSYEGISIRDALAKINAPNYGWYLPQVQRQYVWGARHESEEYVCLLLDSLLRRYPIGGIVLWETDQRVPYRKFIEDYLPGQFARQVDEGLWENRKALVYDGQQRLQTLYSVLRHRFNGRVLHFDLLFNRGTSESDETGFLFRDVNTPENCRYLRMTEVAGGDNDIKRKVRLQNKAMTAAANADEDTQLLVQENFTSLWDVFVGDGHKAIAYFSVKADTPKEVNGGVPNFV